MRTHGDLIQQFLVDHPEYEAHVKQHPEHGLLLSTPALRIFARWCTQHGYGPADAGARVDRLIKETHRE